MRGQNVLSETVALLGEVSLRPDFDLTPDQKTKIKAIRDEFKAASDKWQADHAAEFQKLDEEMRRSRPAAGV